VREGVNAHMRVVLPPAFPLLLQSTTRDAHVKCTPVARTLGAGREGSLARNVPRKALFAVKEFRVASVGGRGVAANPR
jgi:hypothetical protein